MAQQVTAVPYAAGPLARVLWQRKFPILTLLPEGESPISSFVG
jgi:hypothetical protein